MVIPYSLSAEAIVPRLCVITINCVFLVRLCRYFANLSTLESSSAASISSRRQNGDGLRFCIAKRRHIAVNAFSPPESCIMFCNFLPGGCDMIVMFASRISASSSNSMLPLPPPKSCLNTLSNSILISANFSVNRSRIPVSSSLITPISLSLATMRSSCCPFRNSYLSETSL